MLYDQKGLDGLLMEDYSTGPYSPDQFASIPLALTGEYSDGGEDTDGDGLYNHLALHVGVETTAEGGYYCEGSLYDGEGVHVATVLAQVELDQETEKIALRFPGEMIRETGLDGPYYLNYVTLYEEGWYRVQEAQKAYVTGAYSHTEFQAEEGAPPPNAPPGQPAPIEPTPGTRDVSLQPTLQSSAFSDPDGDAHNASQWQVTLTPGNYSDPVYDSGHDGANLVSIELGPGILQPDDTYCWRIRHQDDKGAWSTWSGEACFATQGQGEDNSPPDQPSNTAPPDGAKVGPGDRLRSSAFSDPDGDAHNASQWQVTLTPGDYSDPVYDSGADATHLSSTPLPPGIEPAVEILYWRVRHRDSRGAWSEWSNETSYCPSEPDAGPDTIMLYAVALLMVVLVLLFILLRRRENPR
jgi:hypothetical protein